jgi:hypothetical protein
MKDYMHKTFDELTEEDFANFLNDIIVQEAKGVKSNDPESQRRLQTIQQEGKTTWEDNQK